MNGWSVGCPLDCMERLWCAQRVSVVSWGAHGRTWVTHGLLGGCRWVANRVSDSIRCISIVTFTSWAAHGLPTDTPRAIEARPMGAPPRTPHGQPMDDTRKNHGITIGDRRITHGHFTENPQTTNGKLIGGKPMCFPRTPHGRPMNTSRTPRADKRGSNGGPRGIHGLSMRYRWVTHGMSVGCPTDTPRPP